MDEELSLINVTDQVENIEIEPLIDGDYKLYLTREVEIAKVKKILRPWYEMIDKD